MVLEKDSQVARWIWYPKAQDAVNFHFFARRKFSISPSVREALLYITAFTDYRLFVNGRCVGCGPLPGDPARLVFYDTYDVSSFLTPGVNVIGVICHNYGIGIHGQHKGPGGLIAQLELDSDDGRLSMGTDGSWKVLSGDCFRPNSPRMFWSAGFMETFDFHRFEAGWLDSGFVDDDWQTAEVLRPPGVQTRWELKAREIPLLRNRFIQGVVLEHGRFDLKGLQVISFDQLLLPGHSGLVYAQTFIWAAEDRCLSLQVVCDDAFKAFLEGKLVLEQNYDEEFVRTRVWRGFDEYDQVHYGLTGTFWAPAAGVTLKPGWNRLTVAVDQGPGGWGFVLTFLEPEGAMIVQPVVSANRQDAPTWALAGPFESTGFNDSLDAVAISLEELSPAAVQTVDPYRYDPVTDYATLMTCEERSNIRKVDSADPVTLKEGEWCILDLGNIRVGFPTLHVESAQDAILDIGYGQVLFDDRRLRFSNEGMLKYVDRLYIAPGPQE